MIVVVFISLTIYWVGSDRSLEKSTQISKRTCWAIKIELERLHTDFNHLYLLKNLS